MMMTMERDQVRALDALFAQARRPAPPPGDDLIARVLADAYAQQPSFAAPPVQSRGIWARLSEGLGGWTALGGLSAATAAGVWFGVSPPAAFEDWAAATLGQTETVSLFASGDLYGLTEG
jgi:hypothetical protein